MNIFFFMVVWINTQSVDALECYSCSHVNNTTDCLSMITCQLNENCFTQAHGTGSQLFFQLGCRSHDQCIQHVNQSPSSIVGRSASNTSSCSHCCSIDGCNKALCAFETQLINEKGPCEDDPGFDCVKISSALDVCGDVQHAKLICKKFCGLCDIIDGAWTDWGSWSTCDVTCYQGHMIRTRTCTNPAPEYGGLNCVGSPSDTHSCNTRTCPTHGQWSLWTLWDSYSVTCGIGLRRRYRNCSNPRPSFDGHYCFGNNMGVQICTEKPCGGWNVWSSWSSCSVSCGVGLQKRTRACNSSDTTLSGNSCKGSDVDTQLCTLHLCKPDPVDCLDVLRKQNAAANGVYDIRVQYNKPIMSVYCDMTTDGGGWTVFQKRFDGSLDFYRTFKEYEDGFGDVHTEFWLGLKQLYDMTSNHLTELRIDLTAADDTTAYETYQNFSLSPGPDYTLHIGQAAGTAGHGLSYNKGYGFSTNDKDVDGYNGHCAGLSRGGWWYNSCSYVNLNGDYVTPGTTSTHYNGWGGVVYYKFKGYQSLQTTKMMFRRKCL